MPDSKKMHVFDYYTTKVRAQKGCQTAKRTWGSTKTQITGDKGNYKVWANHPDQEPSSNFDVNGHRVKRKAKPTPKPRMGRFD